MPYFIHREGRPFLIWTAILLMLTQGIVWLTVGFVWWILLLCACVWLMVLQFFRVPILSCTYDTERIYAPADGTILHIQPIYEPEYFRSKRMCISIFMSPTDPHINRAPVNGHIIYQKHHPGKYFMAFYKKSSKHNEHTSCVFRTPEGREVLVKQIAGFIARRIACYVKEGDSRQVGDEYGFIRFGSRMEVMLPTNEVKLLVHKGERVRAGRTPIAQWRTQKRPKKNYLKRNLQQTKP